MPCTSAVLLELGAAGPRGRCRGGPCRATTAGSGRSRRGFAGRRRGAAAFCAASRRHWGGSPARVLRVAACCARPCVRPRLRAPTVRAACLRFRAAARAFCRRCRGDPLFAFLTPPLAFRLAIAAVLSNLDSFAISVVLSVAYRNSANRAVRLPMPVPAAEPELAGRRPPLQSADIDRPCDQVHRFRATRDDTRRTRKAWRT